LTSVAELGHASGVPCSACTAGVEVYSGLPAGQEDLDELDVAIHI
jgi:hypothetical protein